MDRISKLGMLVGVAGLAALGTVAVLLAAGMLGRPVMSDGALPWWGPVSRWGMAGVAAAVSSATVFLAVLWAMASLADSRHRVHARGLRSLLLTDADRTAVLDQLTGGLSRGH